MTICEIVFRNDRLPSTSITLMRTFDHEKSKYQIFTVSIIRLFLDDSHDSKTKIVLQNVAKSLIFSFETEECNESVSMVNRSISNKKLNTPVSDA